MKKPKIDIEPLRSGLDTLNLATERAVAVSDRSIGKIHTGRQLRALSVYAKLLAHNMAIIALTRKFLDAGEQGMLDHFSIATVARASIDAALMTMYISEPKLTLQRWDFRRQLIFLHDINNRSRFLKPLTRHGVDFPFFENYEETRKGILDKIKIIGSSLLYSDEKISEYQRGYHIFIDGVRGAVREAEWDVDTFDFNQSYLSSYVHSHPVSFMRIEEQEISFSGGSRFQIEFCHYIFVMVAEYTQSVVDRMETFGVPSIGDPNGHLE